MISPFHRIAEKKSNNSCIFLMFILFILNSYYATCQRQQPSLTLEERFKDLTSEYLKINPQASGVISIVDSPDKGYQKFVLGHLSQEKNTALKGNELFIAASITKTFVATCILQLEEEGLLSTKDKVTAYLDKETIKQLTTFNGKSYENVITIEHLLRHTSGIFDYLNKGQVHRDGLARRPKKNYTAKERIDFAIKFGSSTNRPGKHTYSNTNYILLGMIAEYIEKKPISQILAERIIKPLKLKNSSLNPPDEKIAHMFRGYYKDIDLTSFTLQFNKENAAGGLLTNTNDLIVFAKALFRGKLFNNKSTLDKMLDFHKDYGLGVMLFDKSRKTGRIMGHNGYDPGYTTYFIYLEKLDTVIITVINQSELEVVMPAFLVVKMVALLKDKS